MTIRPLALFLLTVACTGPKDPVDETPVDGDADTDTDADADTHTGCDTGCESGFFEPAFLLFEADFGYDAATRQVRGYTAPNGAYEVDPGIILLYGNAQWEASGFDTADADNFCVIILPITSSAMAPWAAADADVWVGFDYTGDPVLTSCNVNDNQWDPALYGPDPVGDLVGLGGYGVGVGVIAPEWLPFFTTTTYYTDTFVGGYIQAPTIGEDWAFLALPIEVDANFEAQANGTSFVLMPANSVNTGNNIATGAYRLVTNFFWRLGP